MYGTGPGLGKGYSTNFRARTVTIMPVGSVGIRGFASPEPASSAVGALATTTMAGFSSRPFNVQAADQACMTVPGRVHLALLLGHRLVQVGIERLADRIFSLDPIALQHADETAFDAFQAFAHLDQDVRLARPTAGGRLSMPRFRFSAASTTSVANFCTAYWRASSASLRPRARTLAFSASARIQRSFISASSASSAAMRSLARLHHLFGRQSASWCGAASGAAGGSVRSSVS